MDDIEHLRQRLQATGYGLRAGLVIPAHPLALRKDRTFDENQSVRSSGSKARDIVFGIYCCGTSCCYEKKDETAVGILVTRWFRSQ
jgi:hypothetical protein